MATPETSGCCSTASTWSPRHSRPARHRCPRRHGAAAGGAPGRCRARPRASRHPHRHRVGAGDWRHQPGQAAIGRDGDRQASARRRIEQVLGVHPRARRGGERGAGSGQPRRDRPRRRGLRGDRDRRHDRHCGPVRLEGAARMDGQRVPSADRGGPFHSTRHCTPPGQPGFASLPRAATAALPCRPAIFALTARSCSAAKVPACPHPSSPAPTSA